MSAPLAEAVSHRLPLDVERVEYGDPVLTLSGDGWSLSVVCPWRLMAGSELRAALGSAKAAESLEQLVGTRLERIEAKHDLKDPAFEFTGGRRLEIFADTDLDPWVMHLDDHAFVGVASDP